MRTFETVVVWRASAGAFVLAVIATLLLSAGTARADGTPDIEATVTSSSVLYGNPVHVTASASNPSGEPYGYNLSFRVVLPAGVSYAGGAEVAPRQVEDEPAAGQTTLIFENVSDLSPGSNRDLDFDLQYSNAIHLAGDTFPVSVEAFVNSKARYVPDFNADGEPVGPEPESFTGYTQAVTGTQTLKPIEVEISEPSPEGEILRGVHDNHTVYTLTAQNNSVNPTTEAKLDAYLPAELEMLSCGGPEADNTSEAPTNAGSAEEYPGSGPIAVAPLEGCVEPSSVETEVVDPDGPGPLSEAVYTHVVWPLGALAAGESRELPFRAAVPIRANTNTFTGPRPSPESGDQAVNLDNNSGTEVVDETALPVHATVTGTYQGESATPASDQETLTRTAEDWVVRKSASSDQLAQGQLTTWTLRFETSEYKYVDNATVTDTVPSGLCPLGSENFTTGNTPDDSECDPVGGQTPSATYAAVTENSDGTFTVSWDSESLANLGHTAVGDDFTITFPTRTRANYQQNFESTTPILGRDRITNDVETEGAGFARCTAPGTSDCSTVGPKIDFEGEDGSVIGDESSASQVSGAPSVQKAVAQSGTDCQEATYVTTVPVYHPGDRVCWRLRIEFPGAVHTNPEAIADYIPASAEYESGSDEATSADTVESTVDESGAADGLLTWTVSGSTVPSGSMLFEHVFSTIATPTGAPAPGDLTGNLLKLSSVNTSGESLPQRDEAEYEIETPVLGLTKGVEEIVRSGSTVDGPNGPDVDGKRVEAGDEVTYRVDVENSGGQDAVEVEVWDELPAQFPCAAVSAISNGGECVAGESADRIVWTLSGLAAAGSEKLDYTATVPSDIGPGRTLDNEAGVRTFQSETNLGGFFDYVPAENIDSSLDPEANAPAADDPSNVFTAGATVEKSRTTIVEENGNSRKSQATIGESIHYTVTATVPEGTTVGGTAELTDLFDDGTTRQEFVPPTAEATLNGEPLPAGFSLETGGSTPRLQFPENYSNPSGSEDDVIVLTFGARVIDVEANSRTAGPLTNQATLAWEDEGQRSVDSNTVATEIVEPLIGQSKSDDVNPAAVGPGEIVTYTLTTSNSEASRVSTAHEVELADQVPVGLTPLGSAPANEPLGDGDEVPGSGGATWDAESRTISKSIGSMAPGGNSAFSYRAEVDEPAVAGATLTNTVESTTNSLGPGASGRRTSGTGYAASAEDTISVAAATIEKQVAPGQATPGESLTYTLTVTIPPDVDLYDTTVYDVLPAGVAFDSYVSETCQSGCPPVNPINRYEPQTDASGPQTIGWDLGDIPHLAEPMVLELTYDAHLLATERSGDAVVAGDTEVNVATIGSNLEDEVGEFNPEEIPEELERTESTESTVTVVEPTVTIDKQVAVGEGSFGDGPAPVHTNDSLSYRLIVGNSGDAPAYDVTVTDAFDPALTDVEVVPQAGVTVTSPWTEASGEMTLAVAGPIPAEGQVTIEYTAGLVPAAELSDGQSVPNTGAIPLYFGVPAEDREAEPEREYREYEDGEDTAEVVVDFPQLDLTKTTGLTGNPDTGTAEIGQSYPWRVVVENESATAGATDVEFEDVLPPNWSYVEGSTTFSTGEATEPAVIPEASGDVLVWRLPAVGPEASVTIAFEARPSLAAATNPGTEPEANVNTAEVTSALDEAGNSGDAEGQFSTDPDTASATLAVPALDVEKTPDGGAATAGEASSFTVTVANEGDAVAREVDVTDVLPDGLAYAEGSATAEPEGGFSEPSVSPGPEAGETTIRWAIASIPVGDQVQVTVPVEVVADVADGTTLVNDVSATSVDTSGTVEDEGSLEVSAEADMAVGKSGDAAYTAGEEFTWQLRVRNLGPSDAQEVVVTDPLPSGTTFVSADPPCAGSGATVSCALGTAPAGFDETYDVTVQVEPETTAAPLDNTASVETVTTDPEPGNDESSHGPEPSPLADIWVEKSAEPESVLRTHESTFTIVVHNDGPSVARDVALQDELPAGLEFVSVDDGDCGESEGSVTCSFGDLSPGGERTVRVTVEGVVNGIHVNTATVSSETPEPAEHKPNTAEAEVEVGPVADLGVEKAGPESVAAGGRITWHLTAVNNGVDPATGVEIADTLPAGVEFVEADAGCVANDRTVTCEVGALAVSETAERRITVEVPIGLAGTMVVNSATVSGDQGDDEPANDSDEAETQVGPAADVSVVKTGPARVNAEGSVAWTIVVANEGPSTATGVVLEDSLPDGVELDSADATQGSCGDALRCELGALPEGGSAQVRVIAEVPASQEGQTLRNEASVTANEPDPDESNNEDEAETAVDPPAESGYDLSISKRVLGSGGAEVGGLMAYGLVVANSGPDAASRVRIIDALPRSVRYVSAKTSGGRCVHRRSTVVCRVGSLPAGARARVVLRVRVLDGGAIANTASVSAAVGDEDPSNDADTAPVRAARVPAKLVVRKARIGGGAVRAGDRVRFRIRVRNAGRGFAEDVVVCDRPSAGLSFVRVAGAKFRRGMACWTIDLMRPRGAATFGVVAKVGAGARRLVRNLAVAGADNARWRGAAAAARVEGRRASRPGGVTG